MPKRMTKPIYWNLQTNQGKATSKFICREKTKSQRLSKCQQSLNINHHPPLFIKKKKKKTSPSTANTYF